MLGDPVDAHKSWRKRSTWAIRDEEMFNGISSQTQTFKTTCSESGSGKINCLWDRFCRPWPKFEGILNSVGGTLFITEMNIFTSQPTNALRFDMSPKLVAEQLLYSRLHSCVLLRSWWYHHSRNSICTIFSLKPVWFPVFNDWIALSFNTYSGFDVIAACLLMSLSIYLREEHVRVLRKCVDS